LDRQLTEIRRKGQAVSSRIEHQQLTDEDKAIFYSSWIYLAVWLGASIPELGATEALAQRLGISERRVTEVLRFLLERGLLVQKKGGHYELGQKVIHVPADSPFILKHHMNWRVRAFQSMDSNEADDLHYSAPMALSQKLVPKIREELLRVIHEQTKSVADSPSETLMCLNIDWFRV
jgi:DNA-binding transcriptional MocR family regulator